MKSMKVLLKKVVGKHKLTFEELSTVLAEAEATLNSRSLIPIDSTSPDGVSALTPGHFLIGRPLRAPPARVDLVSKECNLKKWNLLHLLNSQFWSRWTKQYLQSLQQRQKWQYRSENLKPGDVVLLKEIDPTRRYWLLARILKVHLGQDGCVRVVNLFCDGKEYRRPVQKLVPLVQGPTECPSSGGSVSRLLVSSSAQAPASSPSF